VLSGRAQGQPRRNRTASAVRGGAVPTPHALPMPSFGDVAWLVFCWLSMLKVLDGVLNALCRSQRSARSPSLRWAWVFLD
jgi:hypothetical protein